MDKVVVFDWGGVVESHEDDWKDLKEAKIRMIRKFNRSLSDEEILNSWTEKTPDGISMYTTNNIEYIKRWVNDIQKNININVPFEEFKSAYEEELKTVKYYKDVVEFAHSLKDRCKVGILSNLIAFDKKRINDQYDLSKFDYVYLSYEIGLEKSDKRIYEYVLNDLKVKPENILLIDDWADNLSLAKEFGWSTCQAFGYELDKIKKSVNDFLIQNN